MLWDRLSTLEMELIFAINFLNANLLARPKPWSVQVGKWNGKQPASEAWSVCYSPQNWRFISLAYQAFPKPGFH